MKKSFNVTGMGCTMCSTRIQNGISKMDGVKSCLVNLATNKMVVEFDEKVTSSEEICTEVENLGYGIEEGEDPLPKKEDNLKKRLIVSIVFSIPLFLISMIPFFSRLFSNDVIFLFIKLVLMTPVVVVNFNIYKLGFLGLKSGLMNMDTLVSLGTIASFLIGYYDSVSMILTIITLGKFIEEKAKRKTTSALDELSSLIPDNSNLLIGDDVKEISTKDVKLGDILIVYPGSIIPLDGIVISGKSHTNNSIITGESDQVEIKEGDKVIGGTINIDGYIKYKVTSIKSDTTVTKIINLVKDIGITKAPISRLADKLSNIFVPIIIFLSILTFTIWMIIDRDFNHAITCAISVIVISCPCALGLATPLSIMVGSGISAKNGIIFKNAESLENLGKVKKIVFDKTGTITKGIVKDDLELSEKLSGKKNIKVTNDILKEEVKDVIKKLDKENIKTVLLSGDSKEKVVKISKEAGINTYYYEVDPIEKNNIFKSLKTGDEITVMVGDGVNDAAALKLADIGVSIGSGTDIAISSSDVILMNDNLYDLIKAINISRNTIKNIKLSLFWALIYNIICIPLAAGLYSITLNPIISSILMSISSITVTLNSLSLRKKKID